MKRLAAGTGFTGLGLLSMVAFILSKSSDLGLERTVLVLFLFGIALLVLGGSGCLAIRRHASSADGTERHPAESRSRDRAA